jgi:hypothetical protein
MHATRRGGARREVSARVTLAARDGGGPNGGAAEPLEGWALNVSRGGVRVILEQKVELGAEFEVTLADGLAGGRSAADGASMGEMPTSRIGRIVWVQEEPDGVVAGIEFREQGP